LSGEGIVISVPKYVENRVGKICYGDMVSWKGLWHRVKAVIDDERCENVRVSLI
jgi:hypothetical protein